MRLQILEHQLLRLSKLQITSTWNALRVRVLVETILDEINWYKQTWDLWRCKK